MNLRERLDHPVRSIVLAEGKIGEPGGKTANGVVMHSEIIQPVAVVDSTKAGISLPEALGRSGVDDIPIVASVEAAIEATDSADALVIGVAPPGGELPDTWVAAIEAAIRAGCDVISGLHVFLSEDSRWRDLAAANGVRLFDVRKPPDEGAYRVADGAVDEVDADIVLTMGTDCAIGKRTTTYELYRAAVDRGYDASWVATGQTGIMVGAHRGIAMDRVPSDFVAGLIEQMVVELDTEADLIFVEGQGSLTHRAYSGVTLSILHGAWPDAVVLATEPTRERRVYFEQWPVAGVDEEIDLIERLADTTVAAVSSWDAGVATDLPTANVYDGGAGELLDGVEAVL